MSDSPWLPESLLSAGDPVPENPFQTSDQRHQIWADATHKAEESLHRFNAKLLEEGARRY